MNVTYPTTPAQYFHLLRRQMKRNFRKPLVVAGPKGLLRLAVASSESKDFAPGTRFRPVLDDPSISTPYQVTRIIILTGKLYYPLLQARQTAQHSSSVAFIRIEELSPFPFRELQQVIQRYENAKEVVWMQEEPRNQGALPHVGSRIRTVLDEMGHGHGKLVEWCRSESPMPVTGVGKVYAKEQGELVARAFEGL
jgi:probable 2-oxoglutarate dehydrogenase E1 component DHKTD1